MIGDCLCREDRPVELSRVPLTTTGSCQRVSLSSWLPLRRGQCRPLYHLGNYQQVLSDSLIDAANNLLKNPAVRASLTLGN